MRVAVKGHRSFHVNAVNCKPLLQYIDVNYLLRNMKYRLHFFKDLFLPQG